MKAKKKFNLKFTTIIVAIFLLFSLVLVAIIYFFTSAALEAYSSQPMKKEIEQVANQYSSKTNKSFKDVKVEKYLGQGSFVQILNKNNKIVYSSNKKFDYINYSNEELSAIAGIDELSFANINEFIDSKGERMYLLTQYKYNREEEKDTQKVMILDNSHRVIYSSSGLDKKILSHREFGIISNLATDKYYLSKVNFRDRDDSNYTMIIFVPKNFKNKLYAIYNIYFHIIAGFLICYILILILSTYLIYRIVNKPLNALNEAMLQFEKGEMGEEIYYKGPKEFVRIVDQFNLMSKTMAKYEEENLIMQKEKQKIITDISHDLKTPITVVKGYLSAIEDGLIPDEEKASYLGIISKKINYLSQLIDQFHDYEAIQHPDNIYNLFKSDIVAFSREYFAKNIEELFVEGYDVKLDLPDDRIFVSLDEIKFTRVFYNLISNFVKYNDKGTTLYFTIKEDGNQVYIYIGDNGSGISEDVAENLFDPFITSDKVRKKSSGLGLALVKAIVEGHGGTIILEENPPVFIKTQFKITLKKLK